MSASAPPSLEHDDELGHAGRGRQDWIPSRGQPSSLSPSTLPLSEQSERVEQSVPALSPRCGVANPTRGTTLRRKLASTLAMWTLSVWRTDVPLRACVFGSLAGCAMGSPRRRPHGAGRRACVLRTRICAGDHGLSCLL